MVELSVEDILEIHKRGIERWGGDGRLKAETRDAVGAALYSASYHDGVIAYAAALLCYLARAQHFMDGSKRTGWGSCVRALELNGFTLDVTDESAASFVKDAVVVGRMDVADIAERISDWLTLVE
ncbi:MAG TPA: Fic family protein [Kofleriaceae bacterium]|nr:Fic family protein [Kofleriaceae bacterium]